jgi:hypothetical protein
MGGREGGGGTFREGNSLTPPGQRTPDDRRTMVELDIRFVGF